MAKRIDSKIEALFQNCERRGICLTVNEHMLRKALLRRVGSWVSSPYPGVFARTKYWDSLNPAERHCHTIRALGTIHTDWVFCSFSAAALLGLEVSWRHLNTIHICGNSIPHSSEQRRIMSHRVAADEPVKISGVNATPPAQTVADCLTQTTFSDGMPIADSGLALHAIEREEIESRIFNGRKYKTKRVKTALKTLEYSDPRAESGGESVARAVMIVDGYAPDYLQYEFDDPVEAGRIIRCDFGWDQMATRLTLGELDGLAKYTDKALLQGKTTAQALVKERQRESHLSLYGHPLVRFTMRDVREPGKLADIIKAAGVKQKGPADWLDSIDV